MADGLSACLGALDDAERRHIAQVLERDVDFQADLQKRVSAARRRLAEVRTGSAVRVEASLRGRRCARCQADLGVLFGAGAACRRCKVRVCSRCQCAQSEGSSWLCSLCQSWRELASVSGEWFYGASPRVSLSCSQSLLSSIQHFCSATTSTESATDVNAKPPRVDESDRQKWKSAVDLIGLMRRLTRSRQPSYSNRSQSHALLNSSLVHDYYADQPTTAASERSPSLPASATVKDAVSNDMSPANHSHTLAPLTTIVKAFSTGQLPDVGVTRAASSGRDAPSMSESSKANSDPSLPEIFLSPPRDAADSAEDASMEWPGESWTPRSGSVWSVSTMSGGGVPVQGAVALRLAYACGKGALEVHVQGCRGLVQIRGAKPNAYVKTFLLPDRSAASKRKTRVRRNTIEPQFGEVLKYAGLTKSELDHRTLLVTVWHNDYFGRNSFLGESRISIADYSWSAAASDQLWYALYPKEMPSRSLPVLSFSIKFAPPDLSSSSAKGLRLGAIHCLVLCARQLPACDTRAPLTVKARLAMESGKVIKLATPSVPWSPLPVWNYTFVFSKQSVLGLQQQTLQLALYSASNCLGRFLLKSCPKTSHGPTYENRGTPSVDTWRKMASNPNSWIDAELVMDLNPQS